MNVYEVRIYREDPSGFRGYDFYIIICNKKENPITKLETYLSEIKLLQYVNMKNATVRKLNKSIIKTHSKGF